MKLLNILKEINIIKKDVYKDGISHDIYKSLNDTTKLFKVSKPDNVDVPEQDLDWITIFKENPKYFPKIFRSNNRGAEVEKLDAYKAFRDIVDLEQFVDELYDYGTLRNICKDIIDHKEDKKQISKIGEILKNNEPKLLETYLKLLQLMSGISKINLPHTRIDIHSGNFGYDNKGKLKMIDI